MEALDFQKTAGQAIAQLTAAVQNAGIYPEGHPQVLSYLREAHRLLAVLAGQRREITLLLIGGSLMVDKRPLTAAGACEAACIQVLRNNDIERITFHKGLSLEELGGFVRRLSAGSASAPPRGHAIKVGKLEMKDRREPDEDQDDPCADQDDQIHDLTVKTTEERIRDIYGNMSGGERISLEDTDEIIRQFAENIRRETNPLRLLAETKSNDEYTFTHTANVGILTLFFAENLGFRGDALGKIGVAALLHDVGKVTTPEAILSKPGPLTPEERAVMETHSLKGAINLMEQTQIPPLAALAALEHHMKYDGTGYPRVKDGWRQNITSQMISIADVYDALRTIRPYRPEPMPMDRIVRILRNGSGTAFNPFLVERFLVLVAR